MGTAQDLVQPSAVLRLFERANRARVLVVGDLMLDEYVEGRVERVSPEAPVPVVAVGSEHRVIGGAGHVARVVAGFGAAVEVVGVAGGDRTGDELIAMMGSLGLPAGGVVRCQGRPTTLKTRVVCGAQQIVRLDREDTAPLDPSQLDLVLERLEGATPADVIVLSDYDKGIAAPEVVDRVMSLGRRWGAPVLVDPKNQALERYTGATVLKLNRQEFEAALGAAHDGRLGLGGSSHPEEYSEEAEFHDVEHLVRAARDASSSLGLAALVVTLGSHGMLVAAADRDPVVIPAAAQEVFDVTGAGDVVAGVLALGMVAELDPGVAAPVANVAAGLSVRRRGAQAVEPSELLDLVFSPGASRRSNTRREVSVMARGWRLAGQSLVFTNGCFDLFHPGHLELLRRAAAFGDRLVVAVDSDSSVRRLKGPRRPVVGEATRTAILAALDMVDAVVVFDGDLLELIDDVQPDVLVKGADYRRDQVVGTSLVEQRGGRVELVPLLGEYSTSSVLERIDVSMGIDDAGADPVGT